MSILEYVATFLLLFVAINYGLKYFYPDQFGDKPANLPPVTLSMPQSVKEGDDPVLTIHNNTSKNLPLQSRCPQPPVDTTLVTQVDGKDVKTDLMANQTAGDCIAPTIVPAKQSVAINLSPWKYSLFAQRGTYELSLELPKDFVTGSGAIASVQTRFSLVEPGFITKIFQTFITKPLFNSLLFISLYMPDHNLGLAIIVLTILIKLLLLLPNQHALEGQRKLQMLQPKLDELKKKYPDDAKKQQEETMRLWKEFNINPLQSCLPTLLQFPILIGLFYVIKSGATIATSRHLLYSYFLDKPLTVGHMFLGFDLLKPNLWFFPPLLVIMQFLQMKMMMAKARAKDKEKLEIIDVNPAGTKWKFKMPELNQQTMMLYGLPIMIGVFALKFPSAVSIYWGISTLFGIAQQWYVNREKIKLNA